MSRKSSRENAFRLVYEYIETGWNCTPTKKSHPSFSTASTSEPSDAVFTEELYGAVIENYDFLKSVIERYSKDFSFERIYRTDLAALMISVCELLLRVDVPEKVSVNEAVELSKTYSTEKSASFVNGVLASVIANKEELKKELEHDGEDN